MNMSWASNWDRKHLENISPALFPHCTGFTECSKMMCRDWDSFKEGQWNIQIMQLYVYLSKNCPICGSWQGELCLRNVGGTSIDPGLTESILKIVFSFRQSADSSMISWWCFRYDTAKKPTAKYNKPKNSKKVPLSWSTLKSRLYKQLNMRENK